MKQSISVFCRIKPIDKRKEGNYEISTWEENEKKEKLEIQIPRLDEAGVVNNKQELHRFKFNHIFQKNAYQDQVFTKVAKGVVDNCLAGYNGTIFAYGQTGSGKTFTVTGGPEKYADRGLIPRTLNYLFQQYMKQNEFVYKTHVSYLELYNESGYDLLDPLHDIKQMEDLTKVTILEDGSGGIKIRNLSTVAISTEEEGINQLFIGDTNRAIAETPMNQASTRSHCIFTIHLEIMTPGEPLVKRSKLHLVDLAGSERIGKAGVTGQIATEGKYINLSLHYLEQVIVALSEKKRDHVPYRNSILTSVLRDSLGGNALTTMIATISLEKRNLQESLATCRFAQRVAQIKNEAVLNEELDPSLQIARLKREVIMLKEQLQSRDISTEDLTPEDKHDLDIKMKDFIKDPDPETDINLDGDLRKINYVLRQMKKHINMGGSMDTILNNQGSPNSGQPGRADGANGQKQFQITPEEVIRMKDILEQRDAEITVLTQLLKKEKQKSREYNPNKYTPIFENGGGAREQAADFDGRDSRNSRVSRNPKIDESKRGTDSETDLTADLSLGKKEAFEEFRNYFYKDGQHYESQKNQLKSLISEAKSIGTESKEARSEINKLKGELEHVVRQIAANSAVGHVTDDLEDKERDIRRKIEKSKTEFNNAVSILKQLKPKVDHLQHSLERQRIKMHNEFESWFHDQATKNRNSLTNSRPSSSQSRQDSTANGRPMSRTSNQSNSRSHLTMTGDPTVDSDIADFIAARQRVLQNRQK